MLNRYNPIHLFLASYGNELNRIYYRPILKESKSSGNASLSSFTYNGLVYTFQPELNMFVNQFGHAMDYSQAVALASSLGYAEQEFEGLADVGDLDGGYDRQRSLPVISNQILFGSFWTVPYNWYRQGETWGSQNGLTYFWPAVNYQYYGRKGKSRAELNAGNYNTLTTDETWQGIGTPVEGNADIDMSVFPWNTSTGYIGLTFGATGFASRNEMLRTIQDYSWVPADKRVFQPYRAWRAWTNQGISGGEHFIRAGGGGVQKNPWLKRKFSFIRAEHNAFYELCGICGFTMASWSTDDEDYSDFTYDNSMNNDIGWMQYHIYPNNSATGATWYASYTGISAVPDCFVSSLGVTSFKSFLLYSGYTTDSLSWKFVDGITFVGNSNVKGNHAASGSKWEWQGRELSDLMTDWYSGFINDAINDFKTAFGLTANNNYLYNYGYYKTNVGVVNYIPPGGGTYAFTGFQNLSSSDYIPYPDATSTQSQNKVSYYKFNSGTLRLSQNSDNVGGLFRRIPGNMSAIHAYGGFDFNFRQFALDRNSRFSGNSYGYLGLGYTFGISKQDIYELHTTIIPSGNRIRTWYPPNYLGNTATPSGQLVSDNYYCSSCVGISAGVRFESVPGISGGRTGDPALFTDMSPENIEWFLRPVWGVSTEMYGVTISPPNFIPSRGKDIIPGITFGQITVERNKSRGGGGFTSWSVEDFDSCGYPIPGCTLPAGSIYNQYWTHWYPIAFSSLLADVGWGRAVTVSAVYEAIAQRENPALEIPGSIWNGIQKPLVVYFQDQTHSPGSAAFSDIGLGSQFTVPALLNTNTGNHLQPYHVPTGIKFGFNRNASTVAGYTSLDHRAGPMWYENVRHQYLNKAGKVMFYNTPQYADVECMSGSNVYTTNIPQPTVVGGVTFLGVCGAYSYRKARELNDVLDECNNLANGIVSETMYLAPVNRDEREYLISGAQLTNGSYLWRITFAHPATSPVYIRGSVTNNTSGVTYDIAGVTNFINSANNKFGVWWTSSTYEIPIVTNPPISEAQRLGVVNLPSNPGITYNPFTMIRGATPGGVPIFI